MSMTAALLCLSMAVYQEARGEPLIGQIAVAHVVLNRVRSSAYPTGICPVITQDAQFSFRWEAPKNSIAWEVAVRVADDAINGRTFDPTGGALNYNAVYVHPTWTAGMEGRRIGNHIFWNKVN